MASRSSTLPREEVREARLCSSCIRRPLKRRRSDTCLRWSKRVLMPEEFGGTEILTLSQDFPPVPAAEWEAAIRKDLKGADYEKKLVWRTDEGIAVRPYYRSDSLAGLEGQTGSTPGRFPFVRGSGEAWTIHPEAAP